MGRALWLVCLLAVGCGGPRDPRSAEDKKVFASGYGRVGTTPLEEFDRNRPGWEASKPEGEPDVDVRSTTKDVEIVALPARSAENRFYKRVMYETSVTFDSQWLPRIREYYGHSWGPPTSGIGTWETDAARMTFEEDAAAKTARLVIRHKTAGPMRPE